MARRLENALASGKRVSGADAIFYTHELADATMMARGILYEDAQAAALRKHGVSPLSVFHPDVIPSLPPGHLSHQGISTAGCINFGELNNGLSGICRELGIQKSRIWLDELPSTAIRSNEAGRVSQIFECGSAIALRRLVAIEVFQGRGASFYHGLLGGEYQPTRRGALVVAVPLDTPFPNRLYSNSLAGKLDAVTIGGLPQFAIGIRAGVQQVDVSERPCGVLNLTCMAHGEVGSAPIVYGSLARALLFVLCRSDPPASLDEVMALIWAPNSFRRVGTS
jgi:hypothetical protein